MKIFASIVAFAFAVVLGVNLDGLLGGAMASSLDCFNFAVIGVVIVLILFLSGENKELKKDIAELRKLIEEKIAQDSTKENE